MRVALEAMGNFPLEPLVAGAIAAARADNHLRITFVGIEHAIAPHLRSLGKLSNRLFTAPSSQLIGPDEDPVHALRVKPDSSVARLWQLLMEQKVEAIITHAAAEIVFAAGMRYRRLLRGVRRPALVSLLPTRTGTSFLVGPALRADQLYQGGVMAWVGAQQLFQKEQPSIGLLSPGVAFERHA